MLGEMILKKRIVGGLIAVAIILAILFFMNENKTYTNEADYLRKNNEVINLQDIDDFSGLEVLNKDLKDKKIVFTGENHTLTKDDLFKIKLLKYLHKEIGINYYLGEFSSTDAYFINKYLDTGDESILRKSFNHNKGTAGYNVDDFNFFKQLYKYNQSISNEKNRIKVVGIDIEHSGVSSHDYIYEIIRTRRRLPLDLESLLESLRVRDLKAVEIKNKKVIEDVSKNEELYKETFGKNFDDFKYVLNNIKAMCDSYKNINNDNVREKYIYENFKYVDSKLKDAKYFGQWGRGHIYKDKVNLFGKDDDFIASRLNKDEDYKGKILSIQYGYYNIQKGICSIDINLFNEYLTTKDDAILFKLNSKNSPFNDKHINLLKYEQPSKKDIVTTDYFDYLLMIKGSEKSKLMN